MGRYVLDSSSEQSRSQMGESNPIGSVLSWLSDTFGPSGNLRGSAVGGVMQGMANPVVGAIQTGAHALGLGEYVDPAITRKEDEYQQARRMAGRTGIDAAQMVGEVLSPANLAVGARFAPSAAPSLTARLAGGAGAGAGAGAVGGLLTPVTSAKDQENYWTSKGKQAVTGAAVGAAAGAALQPVAGAAARLVSPNASKNQEVRDLINSGVRLTPGQVLGGMASRVEDKARSFFGLGDAITAAQRRGESDLNVAVINGALEKVGPIAGMPSKVLSPGHDSILQLSETAQKAYDNVVPHLFADLADPILIQKIQGLRGSISILPPEHQKSLKAILDNEVVNRMGMGGKLSGSDLQDALSALKTHAIGFSTSQSKYERDAGSILSRIHEALREALERGNPKYAKQFKDINTAYRILSVIRKAASSPAALEGVFTPSQFHSAVRAKDFSKDRRAFAEGGAFLQNLSQPAKDIMSSHYNDSGTAGRLALSAGAVASGLAHPAIPLSLLGASAMYAPTIQKQIVDSIIRRPLGASKLADLIRARGGYATPGVAGAYMGEAPW